MRILVVSQYFYPETFRINDVVRELVNRGHEITVLTGLPNYPEGKIYPEYEKSYLKTERYFGALVHRCKLRPRKKGSFNLLLNYLSFIRQAKKTLRQIKPEFDVIYFYEPSPISSGIPVVWYGKKHKIKTIIYNLDIWPDCVRDSRGGKVMSKRNPIYLVAKYVSKKIYKKFDLIINKCDEFSSYLNNLFNIPPSKMISLSEHAEDVYLGVPEKPINNDVLDFMFLGNIGKTQNCDQMVKAFSLIDNSKAAFHFVGEGSYANEIKRLVDELGLSEKVHFYGRKTIDEVIDYYRLADVCVLALSNKTISGLTPPGKLFSYMAAARPIVASINGPASRIIREANCGLVTDADNVDSLADSMRICIEQTKMIASMGSNGRATFLNCYTLKSHVDSLERVFNSLVK